MKEICCRCGKATTIDYCLEFDAPKYGYRHLEWEVFLQVVGVVNPYHLEKICREQYESAVSLLGGEDVALASVYPLNDGSYTLSSPLGRWPKRY